MKLAFYSLISLKILHLVQDVTPLQMTLAQQTLILRGFTTRRRRETYLAVILMLVWLIASV